MLVFSVVFTAYIFQNPLDKEKEEEGRGEREGRKYVEENEGEEGRGRR